METIDTQELERLQKYAVAANNKVLASQADLDPKDKPLPELASWCEKQGDVVVMKSGLILTSNPSARSVQNCKIMLMNMGIVPGKVVPATSALINLILANSYHAEVATNGVDPNQVSVQQQRLRVLVKEAILVKATDIHVEVREEVARILFRKNGELYLHAEWLTRVGKEIASVAFNKETDHAVSHFNPSVPQNASMPLSIDGVEVRLRLASLPAHGGFDMVMRVLTAGQEKTPDLSELGYRPDQIRLITAALQRPHGAILVSGPTGSGKTTTLASCLQQIESTRKIYTIEDPIEKIVENATQVPVNTEREDRDFAMMGRAALRMDPNVIVLGETRDEDTATVLMRAAITGHLVFSTVHTNSAVTIVSRLIDLGVSSLLLADSNLLVCLVSQRLVPVLCERCSIPLRDSREDIHSQHFSRWTRVFGEAISKIKARGKNCLYCNSSGVRGRTVVAEVIWVDPAGRQFIGKCDTFGWESYLKSNGWLSYAEHARQLVIQGVCDPIDAERVVGEFDDAFTADVFNYKLD